jgi:hypothetical protein
VNLLARLVALRIVVVGVGCGLRAAVALELVAFTQRLSRQPVGLETVPSI